MLIRSISRFLYLFLGIKNKNSHIPKNTNLKYKCFRFWDISSRIQIWNLFISHFIKNSYYWVVSQSKHKCSTETCGFQLIETQFNFMEHGSFNS